MASAFRRPWIRLLAGLCAYIVLAFIARVWVLDKPEGNRFLHLVILALLGFAFVAAAEAFLCIIRAVPSCDADGWPFISGIVGSLAYTLVYAERVFVNVWYFDDWSYLKWVGIPLDKAFLTEPINDHFVPLLKAVLWSMVHVFKLDYIGAACLQQGAFLMIVVVLGHLLWRASRQPWIILLSVGLFAMWPSYGTARSWFGGGFWLTASTALLGIYILHTYTALFGKNFSKADLLTSAIIAFVTVGISSQTIVPAIFLVVFYLPSVLPSNDGGLLRRLASICGISLIPSALALWGRSHYVARPPFNLSGLVDGSLFRNLGVFIVNKVLFTFSYGWFTKAVPLEVLGVAVLLPLIAAGVMLLVSRSISPGQKRLLAGLLAGGCTIFVASLAQVGMGRRWSYDAVLNPYYVTFPFLGVWLIWSCTGLCFFHHSGTATPRSKIYAGLAVGALLVAAFEVRAADISLLPDAVLPLAKRIELIHHQQRFMAALGGAVCDLARMHAEGPEVRWSPNPSISTCHECEDVIGPSGYLESVASQPMVFSSLVRVIAQQSCPSVDLRRALPDSFIERTTTGTESPVMRQFVNTYFLPRASAGSPGR